MVNAGSKAALEGACMERRRDQLLQVPDDMGAEMITESDKNSATDPVHCVSFHVSALICLKEGCLSAGAAAESVPTLNDTKGVSKHWVRLRARYSPCLSGCSSLIRKEILVIIPYGSDTQPLTN